MGRIAMELHRRGMEVEGADLDDDLLAFARVDAPQITWHLADLASASFGRTYQLIAMPGNVGRGILAADARQRSHPE